MMAHSLMLSLILMCRCRVLHVLMTYLTLTTYCWMLCEGGHIYICLVWPLQVRIMVMVWYGMVWYGMVWYGMV